MPEEMATDREWRAVAEMDPLWAVASWPGKRGTWTEDEFYALGASDWADCLHHWSHYTSLGGTCVEVGAGAGRMTRHMAMTFDRVLALDVSDRILELCAKACPPNVETMIVSGTTIPLEAQVADAVFTTHVLQHLDGLVHVTSYLAEMFRVLRPGGTAMIHVGLSSTPATFWQGLPARAKLVLSRRAQARGRKWLNFRTLAYRPEEMRAALKHVGFEWIELRVFPMRSNGDPHPFWFVTRV